MKRLDSRCILLLVLVLALGVGRAEGPTSMPNSSGSQEKVGPQLLSLQLIPPRVTLTGEEASQQFLVIGAFSGGRERDLSQEIRFRVSDPNVARVDASGHVVSVADGVARLTAEVGNRSTQAEIRVEAAAQRLPMSFHLDVAGILTRNGCNSSECHGSVNGRAGFKLSINGSNLKEDHRWIVRGGTYQVYSTESAGPSPSRIDLEAPDQSLLLLKPTLQMPHGGGHRLRPESADYERLLEWIRSGAPYADAEKPDLTIERLEVFPREVVLEKQNHSQLMVTAHFSNGRPKDFTRRVHYESAREDVVEVSRNGLLKAHSPGETFILIRGPQHAVSANVAVLARTRVDYPPLEKRNLIDEEVFAKLRRLSIIPSRRSSDAEFLRRVCLDVTGTLPPPERVRQFLSSRDPQKRDRLIATLLNSPEYVDYWTFRFADLFRVSYEQGGRHRVKLYWEWIRDWVSRNKPFDRVAWERLASQGYDGPTRHYWGADEIRLPQDIMIEQARVLLGRRLDCAQCHDHPYDSWSQDQFWGLTGFFKNLTYYWDSSAVVDDPVGHEEFGTDPRIYHPRTKKEIEPLFPDGRPLSQAARQDPRKHLAEWLTSTDDLFFEEAIVNRIWGYFFGRGIVEPVDDFRVTNPPTHPSLLHKLATEFRSGGYDLKKLMTLILQSNTYQLSGRPNQTNQEDRLNYSRAQPRALEAEVLLDMISQVSGVGETFDGIESREYGGRLPEGTRAIQVIWPHIFFSRFLDIYGRPTRLMVPERSGEATVSQALHMLAGETYTGKLSSDRGRIHQFLESGSSDGEIIEDLYLAALSRFPIQDEKTRLESMIDARSSRREAWEDLVWAIVASREFAYNH